jgi:hypothetical protein
MTFFIWAVGAGLIGIAVGRVARARAVWIEKKPVAPGAAARALGLVAPAAAIGAALALAPLLDFIGLSRAIAEAALVMLGALAASAAIDGAATILWPRAGAPSTLQWVNAVASVAFVAGLIGLRWWVYSIPDSGRPAVVATFPLQGEWTCVAGGRWAIRNPHAGNPPEQSLAVDLAITGAPASGYGEPVFSPIAGRVERAIDDYGDDEAAPAEGNHIVILAPDGTQIWLAHLARGSASVEAGDEVEAGGPIARVGASGNADAPHLHIHAQRSGRAVAIVFEGARLRRPARWARPERLFVVYGQRLRGEGKLPRP